MTDVLKVARDRRAELQGELARIEDFIDMAKSLMRDQHLPTAAAHDAPPASPIHEVLPAEPAADSEEDEGEAEAATGTSDETADEPEDEDAGEAVPVSAAAASRDAGVGLSRINLLRRGPRMVTN